MAYASKLAIPYAVIIGEDELACGEVSLKDMNAGTQTCCTPEGAALAVRDGLKALSSEKLIKVNCYTLKLVYMSEHSRPSRFIYLYPAYRLRSSAQCAL